MDSTQEETRKLRRIVFATSAGTVFEAYDFILFGSLAPIISVQFFSGVNPTAAFIFTLMTFAAGFVVRPLGALVFGSMGDRTGRKKAFLITIAMMGGATFAIGLLPTYATIGIWAPILLIALRMIQGLAFGGEYGGAVVYTAEHAPDNKRGLFVGFIQTAAGFALFASFLIIFLTRSALGDESFEAWGWRIPFLLSIFLLAISLWIRMSLEESPMFQKMLAEGKAAKRPLREAFGQWKHLKLVILVLLGLMMLQGIVFYTAHFYSQFFITQILKLPTGTMTIVMLVVTGISVPFYLFFSWLSDRVGRKPIILAGGILAVVSGFPLFNAMTAVVNPALAEAQQSSPIVIMADPAECSVQLDPVGQADFISSCDIAKSTFATLGVSYSNQEAQANALTIISIGESTVESVDGANLSADELEIAKAQFQTRLNEALRNAGYPEGVNVDEVNLVLLGLLIFPLIIASTMTYAPCSAMAVELFPTRIRYTGLSLPYHIGSGWFGGFLPAIAFAMVAANGSIYFGLWYPTIMAAISVLVLAFLLPETKGRNLNDI
ncbi:MHS family MFS transporter [Haliea sp. AH-315-K21]|uniref:MFS transporter n=1 Tax=SAR86 cluster bacterium TaxID=2030880 RepID=A0A2A5C8N1_9GAMM|nr:MHS family MFS transporter [Haliea sp. AH-315-K21]PCJ40182.1 MAG: MFS transporter [SAR86 cluster bacterium]